MMRKNTKKSQSGCSATGFEPGTSRMRISCVITEPPRSVFLVLFLPFRRKTRLYNGPRCVCLSVSKILPSRNNLQTSHPIDMKFWLHIQAVREISVILLTVVGDDSNDLKIYTVYAVGSKLQFSQKKRYFFFCFVHVVLFISLEIMRKHLHQ